MCVCVWARETESVIEPETGTVCVDLCVCVCVCRYFGVLLTVFLLLLSVIQDSAVFPPQPHAEQKTGLCLLLLPVPDSGTNPAGN